MESPSERHDPPGETSASAGRPAQRLAGPALRFDLTRELDELVREAAWQRGDRNAKTLVKEPHLHITLVGLEAGAKLDQHKTSGPVSIHTVKGRLRLSVEGEAIDLGATNMLVLEEGVLHDVEALEDECGPHHDRLAQLTPPTTTRASINSHTSGIG